MENNNNKILLFPKMKKSNVHIDACEDLDMYNDVSSVTQHYISELIMGAKNNGFTITPDLLQDFTMVQEVLRSALLRNVHLYHPFQDYIDTMKDMSATKDEENDSN